MRLEIGEIGNIGLAFSGLGEASVGDGVQAEAGAWRG
jgi:hypothetical protein